MCICYIIKDNTETGPEYVDTVHVTVNIRNINRD